MTQKNDVLTMTRSTDIKYIVTTLRTVNLSPFLVYFRIINSNGIMATNFAFPIKKLYYRYIIFKELSLEVTCHLKRRDEV